MARGRMVDKVIAVSTRFKKLDWTGKALYLMLLPHTDDFGRLDGEPEVVRALICPMEKITVASVGKRLEAMADAGLIALYDHAGTRYLAVAKFEEHQTGLHRRTRSRYPPVPLGHPNATEYSTSPHDSEYFRELPGISRLTEGKGRGTESKEPNEVNRDDLKNRQPKKMPRMYQKWST